MLRVLALLLFLSGAAWAQAPAQPSMTTEQRIRFMLGDLLVQNAMLSSEVESLRAQLDRAKNEIDVLKKEKK